MLYRPLGKTGDAVSILGYGCMRFPKREKRIDEERTARQVISAIEQGVNYCDTAYTYPHSEEVLGNILAGGYRDKVLLATKLPLILINSLKGAESCLHTSLRRLQTDYLDYYLVHSLASLDGWKRAKQLGIDGMLERAKAAGTVATSVFPFTATKTSLPPSSMIIPGSSARFSITTWTSITRPGSTGCTTPRRRDWACW